MNNKFGHDPRPAFDKVWSEQVNLDDVPAMASLAEMLLDMLSILQQKMYLHASERRGGG